MTRRTQSGMALVSALFLIMLLSGLLIGFFAVIDADQRASGVNRDQTQAYAAAHAGLEKLTADLGSVFTGGNFSPTASQINDLTTSAPTVPGFQFLAPDGGSGYTISFTPDASGNPRPIDTNGTPISTGNYQGLIGLITPYEITVTARGDTFGGAEVRMRRQLQTVAVPVFQFGVFSEGNVNFAAAPSFAFGGRVHSNQNVFLAHQRGATLTLEDRVTAFGEVVRTHLSNGLQIGGTNMYDGAVNVPTAPGVYRALKWTGPNEGSVTVASSAAIPPATLQMVGDPPKPTMVLVSGATANSTFDSLSTGAYNSYIRNGRTGVKRLDLPLVSDGAAPIDLVRRPTIGSPDNENIQRQRFYHLASVRILLSDRAADLTSLQNAATGDPVDLARLATDSAYRTGLGVNWVNSVPLATATTYSATATLGKGYRINNNSAVQRGFLKIERQDLSGDWHDVTVEVLNLGFTARNIANAGTWNSAGTTCASAAGDNPAPDSIIHLQRVRDNPSAGFTNCGHNVSNVWSTNGYDYIPLTLYDAREGARRDDQRTVAGGGVLDQIPYLGGVMHYVEVDVNNLRRWLEGSIGTSGSSSTMNVTGYVLYFSDRRGNKNLGGDGVANAAAGADGTLGTADDYGDDQETGEYGFEDVVNPGTYNSPSNGSMDTGEDFNSNGTLEVYGGVPRPQPDNGQTGNPWNGFSSGSTAATPMTTAPHYEARVNPPLFFRRAIKIVNGGYTTGTMRLPHNGSQGLTMASENPLYLEGNFNAPNAAGTGWGTTPGTDHVSAAVIADGVTLLSSGWNDIRSFSSPNNDSGRAASNTWYRLAIVSGKGVEFPRPTNNTNDDTDYGTDGGVNNFIRYMESWSGRTSNYLGSLVSFFYSRQGVGTYKCCEIVFYPPTRNYRFDTEFLNPNLLPPRTPMFRDINALTFRQLLRPTQ